jgi:hypothetical protein
LKRVSAMAKYDHDDYGAGDNIKRRTSITTCNDTYRSRQAPLRCFIWQYTPICELRRCRAVANVPVIQALSCRRAWSFVRIDRDTYNNRQIVKQRCFVTCRSYSSRSFVYHSRHIHTLSTAHIRANTLSYIPIIIIEIMQIVDL